ncbi:MAG TPA: zinc ABC transporter substrate-binding protein [Edaphocola sp.]|nr:zinc ABC transporter substrate-binding protein [Edaphocola sp.]
MKALLKSMVTVIGLLAFTSLISCNTNEETIDVGGKIKVLSSFSIISDIVKEIGGEKVVIHNLVPIGQAPHEYEPKPNDVKFTANADMIIYNGLNLEGGESGWFFKLIHSLNKRNVKVFEASKGVTPIYLKDEKDQSEINPHAFINPKVGSIIADNIKNALIKTDPQNTSYYQKNANDYIQKLNEIEQLYRLQLGSLPMENKVFIASELAFQYLTKEYNLKEGCIWKIDTDKNGTPDQLKSAIKFIEANKPPVLFVESNVDPRPMETISNATGVSIYKNSVLSDELGKAGKEGSTYIKYLEYNLETIYNGLKGAYK